MAGGGGSFLAAPVVSAVTSAPSGSWTQIPEPRAIRSGTTTYFGYVNGSTGDVEVRSLPDGGTASAPFVLHAALNYPADTHDAPAIHVRPDGHLVACYSAHNGAVMYTRISTSANDASAWGSETTFGGVAVTYATLVQRLAEAGQPLYIWYRDVDSGTSHLTYRKSWDGGATWGSAVRVFAVSGKAVYWKIASDGQWRIDFVVTDSNTSFATCRIYHFYADDTDYHQSDGTAIGAYGPEFDTSHLTLVYDSSSGPGWPTDACLDASNRPRFVYSVDNGSGTDSLFAYASADSGGAWTLSTVLASVGAGIVDPSPVACIDPLVPTRCLLTRKVGAHFEIWRYTTGDGGMTWYGAPLTSGSSVENLYPLTVRGHAPGTVSALFLQGTYSGAETGTSLAVMGVTG